MNNICRLCLTVSEKIKHDIYQNGEVLDKIWSCLSIKILIDESLPQKLCKLCTVKIEEIYTFSEMVKENELKLKNLLNMGKNVLLDFFASLHNKADIKEEDYIDDNDTLKIEDHFSSDDEIILSHLKNDSTNKVTQESEKHMLKEHSLNCINEFSKHEPLYENEDNTLNKINVKNKNTKTLLNIDTILNLKTEYSMKKQQCLTCFEKFENRTDLLQHYLNEHSNKELNENKDKKYIIKSTENEIVMFLCVICDKMYDRKKSILRHLNCHKDIRPFVCKICGSTYKTVYEIIRHGRVHNGEKLHCTYKCGFSTVYRGALRDHEKRHTKDDNKYTCKKCGKGFQVKTWFEQHQNIHSGKKPYVCDICGVAFHMHRYLTSHISKVHPQSSNLKRYVCVQCSLPCDSKNSLKKHMEDHGIKTSFLCDLCGKVFPNTEQLKYHRNVHLGVKPFTCSTCNKTFSRKFHLKNHEQTHTGERKHGCLKCSKHFTQRSTLLRHMKRRHADPETKLEEN